MGLYNLEKPGNEKEPGKNLENGQNPIKPEKKPAKWAKAFSHYLDIKNFSRAFGARQFQ